MPIITRHRSHARGPPLALERLQLQHLEPEQAPIMKSILSGVLTRRDLWDKNNVGVSTADRIH